MNKVKWTPQLYYCICRDLHKEEYKIRDKIRWGIKIWYLLPYLFWRSNTKFYMRLKDGEVRQNLTPFWVLKSWCWGECGFCEFMIWSCDCLLDKFCIFLPISQTTSESQKFPLNSRWSWFHWWPTVASCSSDRASSETMMIRIPDSLH